MTDGPLVRAVIVWDVVYLFVLVRNQIVHMKNTLRSSSLLYWACRSTAIMRNGYFFYFVVLHFNENAGIFYHFFFPEQRLGVWFDKTGGSPLYTTSRRRIIIKYIAVSVTDLSDRPLPFAVTFCITSNFGFFETFFNAGIIISISTIK